jgi:hypothetical protein
MRMSHDLSGTVVPNENPNPVAPTPEDTEPRHVPTALATNAGANAFAVVLTDPLLRLRVIAELVEVVTPG